ncbi:hypothetical protein BCIN_06g04670 [Botrytis cinerea B05.10]|uniref:Cys met metabolism pyridoxal phosphate-dependent enzyme protein n=3 Tax=Botryotinia fuckeliana TaxID=40559 RepID=A0A384JK96_BOTFB|nr:hypothetical protein BCIN_06g04670 [Botrytis cinerea B05.10]ATZ51018.1 hypothetical protein BCIN_06g04670 [Botrytis cinerea B05.10]EMR87641.1 putative acyl-protein thioesterase 1 protein [Botrytis cinerea BcDW1]CCD56824.1 hypothetical protein BofuT4_P140860.1 [Botrytis cinerea T4]
MKSQHPYAPWRRMILIPCWIVQIIFPGFTFGVVAAAIAQIMSKDFDDDSYDIDVRTALSIGWVYIVFIGLCIILTITEIVLMLRHKLKPIVFLMMNIFKCASWTALFVVSLWNAFGVVKKTMPSIVSLVVDIILLLAFYIPLAHGSLIMHRNRQAGKYEPVNLKHNSFDSTTESFPDAFPQAYKSLTNIEETTDLEANDHTTGRPRRLSYNHTRDTRFDSYRQTRRSFSDPYIVERMVASPTQVSISTFSTRSRSSTLGLPIPQVVVHDHDEFMERNRANGMN